MVDLSPKQQNINKKSKTRKTTERVKKRTGSLAGKELLQKS